MNTQTPGAVALSLCLTACIPAVPTPGAPSAGPYAMRALGATAVTPTTGLKVGRIYRDGPGDGIQLSNGATLSEICERDFRETNALKLVEAGVTVKDAGSNGGSYYQQVSVKPKIGGIGWDLVVGTIGGGYTTNVKIDYTKLSFVEAGEGTREVVLGAIGTRCRERIASHRKAGRNVYILARGVRTDEATITLFGEAGIETGTSRSAGRSSADANVTTQTSSVGASNTEMFKQNLVFLGVNAGDPVSR